MQGAPEEVPKKIEESKIQKHTLQDVQKLTETKDQPDELKTSATQISIEPEVRTTTNGESTLGEKNESPASKGAPGSDRAFKGDWNYVKLFNSDVDTFFDLDYLEIPKSRKRRLQDSVVTAERAYYQPDEREDVVSENTESGLANPEKDLFESIEGVLWTADEKETFFQCLARFTIHRVDDFRDYLPSKSIGEIIAYYELLKRELRNRQIKETHTAFISDNDEPSLKRLRHKHNIVSIPGGISHKDLPIAYEMSEEWVEFEEDQSIHVADRQRRLDIDRGKQEAKAMKEYTKRLESDMGEDFPLIDVNNAFKVGKIYRGNQITMIQDRKPAPRLLFPSLVYLEEIASLTLKRIIALLVWNKKSACDEDQGIKITPTDVWNAVQESRICEAPKSGMAVEKIWKKGALEDYWTQIQRSLRLVTDSEPTEMPLGAVTHDRDLYGVLFSQSGTLNDYGDDLVEEGSYGAIVDESGNELEEDESETEDVESPGQWTVPSPKQQPQHLVPPQVIEVLPEGAENSDDGQATLIKSSLDIAVDDVLLQNETRLLQCVDKRKHEALSQGASVEFEDFASTAWSSDEEYPSNVQVLTSLQEAWNRHALY